MFYLDSWSVAGGKNSFVKVYIKFLTKRINFSSFFLHYTIAFKNMDTAPKPWEKVSVADPDPGSVAFLTPGSGRVKKEDLDPG
jgi:hypothetical protein